MSVKLAVYAHFSSSDNVVAFAWRYLESLSILGFELIFVSNSTICDSDCIRLESMRAKVIVRNNIGLDFGMWKTALDRVDLATISELLLTNSSIIGPVTPLAPIFEKARAWDCDFWGMTDNAELAPHLQSYFIVLNRRVVNSRAFKYFWKSVLPYRSKDQIVMSYEVGFTVWLHEQGFTWRPLVYQKDVWQSYIQSRDFLRRTADRIIPGRGLSIGNTTLLFPDLLLNMGVPFLKRSLLSHGSRRISSQDAQRLLEKVWGHDNITF